MRLPTGTKTLLLQETCAKIELNVGDQWVATPKDYHELQHGPSGLLWSLTRLLVEHFVLHLTNKKVFFFFLPSVLIHNSSFRISIAELDIRFSRKVFPNLLSWFIFSCLISLLLVCWFVSFWAFRGVHTDKSIDVIEKWTQLALSWDFFIITILGNFLVWNI